MITLKRALVYLPLLRLDARPLCNAQAAGILQQKGWCWEAALHRALSKCLQFFVT